MVPREDIVGLSKAENDTKLRDNDNEQYGMDAATRQPGQVILIT